METKQETPKLSVNRWIRGLARIGAEGLRALGNGSTYEQIKDRILSLLNMHNQRRLTVVQAHIASGTTSDSVAKLNEKLDAKVESLKRKLTDQELLVEPSKRAIEKRLPTEIMVQICIFYIEGVDGKRLFLASLNRWWKDLILDTPQLWRKIPINYAAGPLIKVYDPVAHLEKHIRRAKQVLLDITLSPTCGALPYDGEAVPLRAIMILQIHATIFATGLHRWRSLTFDFTSFSKSGSLLYHPCYLSLRDFQNLRSFTIKNSLKITINGGDIPIPYAYEHLLLHLDTAPPLHHIEIPDVFFDMCGDFMFPVSQTCELATSPSFLRFIKFPPGFKHLRISGTTSAIYPMIPLLPEESTALRHVTHAYIRDCRYSDLEHIPLPNLEHLEISKYQVREHRIKYDRLISLKYNAHFSGVIPFQAPSLTTLDIDLGGNYLVGQPEVRRLQTVRITGCRNLKNLIRSISMLSYVRRLTLEIEDEMEWRKQLLDTFSNTLATRKDEDLYVPRFCPRLVSLLLMSRTPKVHKGSWSTFCRSLFSVRIDGVLEMITVERNELSYEYLRSSEMT